MTARKSGSHGALPGEGPGTKLHSLRLKSPFSVHPSAPQLPSSIIPMSHNPTQGVCCPPCSRSLTDPFLSLLLALPVYSAVYSAAETLPHRLGPLQGSHHVTHLWLPLALRIKAKILTRTLRSCMCLPLIAFPMALHWRN